MATPALSGTTPHLPVEDWLEEMQAHDTTPADLAKQLVSKVKARREDTQASPDKSHANGTTENTTANASDETEKPAMPSVHDVEAGEVPSIGEMRLSEASGDDKPSGSAAKNQVQERASQLLEHFLGDNRRVPSPGPLPPVLQGFSADRQP